MFFSYAIKDANFIIGNYKINAIRQQKTSYHQQALNKECFWQKVHRQLGLLIILKFLYFSETRTDSIHKNNDDSNLFKGNEYVRVSLENVIY